MQQCQHTTTLVTHAAHSYHTTTTTPLFCAGFYSCKGSKQAQQRERLAAASARKQPAVNPTDPCDGKPDAKSCDALDECTWCKSAAVPSSCFTVVSLRLRCLDE